MKKLIYSLLLLTLSGCSNILIPSYIQDSYPYDQTFYAPYEEVYAAVLSALEQQGLDVEKEAEPADFDRERDLAGSAQQILLFTRIRQSYFFVGSKFTRMNIYLREMAEQKTHVEIRYVKVSSVMFKSFYGYRNDRAVNRLFEDIKTGLDL